MSEINNDYRKDLLRDNEDVKTFIEKMRTDYNAYENAAEKDFESFYRKYIKNTDSLYVAPEVEDTLEASWDVIHVAWVDEMVEEMIELSEGGN